MSWARSVHSLWGRGRGGLTWPQGLGMLKPGSLTTLQAGGCWGLIQDVRRKTSLAPQRLLGAALHPQLLLGVLYILPHWPPSLTPSLLGSAGEATGPVRRWVGGKQAYLLCSSSHVLCPPLVSVGGLRRLPGNLGTCADRGHCWLLGGAGSFLGTAVTGCLLLTAWPALTILNLA